MGKAAIIWFRNDLRIHDNESLVEASQSASQLLPVYIFDERQFFGNTGYGFRKTGVFRAKFIIESIYQLRQKFRDLGSDLIVRVGKPEEILFDLARKHKTSWIFCNRERTDEEVKVQDALERKLWSIGQEMRYNRGKMLYYTSDLPFPVTQTPDSFTNFRKEVEKIIQIRIPLDSPASLPPLPGIIEKGEIPDLRNLNYSSSDASLLPPSAIHGGEKSGLEWLEKFSLKTNLDNYHNYRYDLSNPYGSSRLGAYLSQGALSPKLVYHKIYPSGSIGKAKKSFNLIFQELMKRDFFRLLGKKYGNDIFRIEGPNKVFREWNDQFHIFKVWADGRTGIPLVDASMRQLNATGYISDIGRQCAAIYLVNQLGVNWVIGAEYFESKLIDYDPCSNYCNWNNIAGVGVNVKDIRTNNLVFQSRKYDPHGKYLKTWLPELKNLPSAFIHKPDEMDISEQMSYKCMLGKDYPLPVLDKSRTS